MQYNQKEGQYLCVNKRHGFYDAMTHATHIISVTFQYTPLVPMKYKNKQFDTIFTSL